MNLQTHISTIKLKTCIFNASGPLCTTEEELYNIKNCDYTGAILTKSCTIEYREGNMFPRYYNMNKYNSINSTGLANLGYKFYKDMAQRIYSDDKPYIVSVAGLSIDDNIKIIKKIYKCEKIKGIELNLSCPNIHDKPQIGYDFDTVKELLYKIKLLIIDSDIIIGLKLPPYFDFVHFDIMSKIIIDNPYIKYITCINSLGNGLYINPISDSTVIKPKKGFGGIGGSIIKPFALSNVRAFYNRLYLYNIDIIGCGGIITGRDAYEHILCGASAIQIGTQFMEEGIGCFERITKELYEIMREKGYNNILVIFL